MTDTPEPCLQWHFENISQETYQALEVAESITRDTRTETVNKAIQFKHSKQQMTDEGRTLVVSAMHDGHPSIATIGSKYNTRSSLTVNMTDTSSSNLKEMLTRSPHLNDSDILCQAAIEWRNIVVAQARGEQLYVIHPTRKRGNRISRYTLRTVTIH